MQTTPPRATWQVATLLVLALAGVLAGSLYARHRLGAGAVAAHPAPATRSAVVYGQPRPMPAFALTDDDGHPAGPEVLRGGWSLLFFGYTHCPDACPATLAVLAQVERELADLPAAQRPHVWLVSVDPTRDTVAPLHEYVRYFDPGFRALTGAPEAVQALTTALGIPVVFKHSDAADYTVDHSVAMLLVDPRGDLAAVFPGPHAVKVVAADYRAILAADVAP